MANQYNRKYPLINKECPVCGNIFLTNKGHKKEKTTCSHSCSNTFFAKRRNKPENYKSYKTICFSKWPKECLICGYSNVVSVHHLDGNHKNNLIDNLIPLCPNHHEEIHIEKYFNNIKEQLYLKNIIAIPLFKGNISNLWFNKRTGVWAKG